MRRYGFTERDVKPADVYENIKSLLQGEGFKVTSEEKRDNYLDLHARKSSVEKIVLGRVRDVDAVVAGTTGKFEVQLHAGVWGRDLMVPAIEGIATLGAAPAVEIHGAHEFEERLWEQVVSKIDPSLKICKLDGMLFQTQEELDKHVQAIQQAQQQAANSMMMYGGMGMMGMGLMGMGMMGGLWI
ncbi:MAG: hypothetical protein JRM74_02920 [Nitrososphaerota archaeon]|jgi:hypothetical protein|nr:hypothetical protein [Nitrososphaerota archaeon]MDG6959205.1 hypothetical protein [Nitrososphaerota archaeon]MDG6965301.1 hypothetical protein [Nitrososphaerota archaeon]MDG6968756.1 hypothetical protein [Nitrososphaerota archaeon]MDG6972668.1 hypothetical protein [Nitrososphaerota archaeon]